MKLTAKEYSNLLDDLDDGSHQYSFFRQYVEAQHPSPRVLIQMKCLEHFKWDLNRESSAELSWNEVSIRWADEGYAEAFRYVYDEAGACTCCSRIYKDVCSRVNFSISSKNYSKLKISN
tara:strand:- start:1333 stop:1689 length:357 start_codon:yes stop_codon:yes gene_type:complete